VHGEVQFNIKQRSSILWVGSQLFKGGLAPTLDFGLCISARLLISKLQGSQLQSTQPRFLKKHFPICGQAVGKFGEKFRSFEQPTPEVCCAGPHQEVLGHSKKIYSYIALQCALILLCLTPDDFTRQGESAGAQWVIEWNFIRSEE
jgi:hypothetical protein